MSDNEIQRKCIRISMLGDAGVGKTSILNVFLGIEFSTTIMSNIGIEKQNKKMKMKDGNEMKIIVWDTAGQERFHSIATSTIQNSHGIALCFDVTKKQSFDNLPLWLKDIKEIKSDIPIILFGNKADLIEKKVIQDDEAEEFARKNKLKYFETSAKENINIDEGFKDIIEDAYEKSGALLGMNLEEEKKNKKKKIC